MRDIHTASIQAMNAARYFAMAAARDMDGQSDNLWLRMAVEQLTEAANSLGYVLVRTRQTEAQTDSEAA